MQFSISSLGILRSTHTSLIFSSINPPSSSFLSALVADDLRYRFSPPVHLSRLARLSRLIRFLRDTSLPPSSQCIHFDLTGKGPVYLVSR